MADYINKLVAADLYTAALSVGPNFGATTLVATVQDNDALFQLAVGGEGNWRWTDEREYHATPQSFKVGRVIGARFRNASPGKVATIIATLAGADDPEFEAGFPIGAAADVIPAGVIQMYGGAAAPTAWLLCDGSAVSRATYAALFTAIGTTFGVGDGATTFNVPDARGRAPAGYAAAGGHVDVATLGNNEGVAAANRRPKHLHTVTDPQHTHKPVFTAAIGAAGVTGIQGVNNSDTFDYALTGITVGVSGALDAPAYLVVNFIIKT